MNSVSFPNSWQKKKEIPFLYFTKRNVTQKENADFPITIKYYRSLEDYMITFKSVSKAKNIWMSRRDKLW